MDNQELHLEDILANPIIKEKFISHLSLSDMKIMNLVSKNFLGMIRESKPYREKAVLVIPNELNYDLECLELKHLLKKYTTRQNEKYSSFVNFPWRGLKVDLSTKISFREFNIPVCQNLEYLAFIHRNKRIRSSLGMQNVLKSLLNSCKKLKHLELDYSVFLEENCKVEHVFLDTDVRGNLENLERLDILELDFALNKKTPEDTEKDFNLCQWEGEEFHGDRMSSFTHLASIPKKLKTFNTNMCTFQWRLHPRNVLELVQNNRETLEELWLPYGIWYFDSMKTLKLPKLKSLHIIVVKEPKVQRILAQFLLNHPQLEKLELNIPQRAKMTSVLFNAFREMCGNLKVLHLGVYKFEFEDRRIDWSFLKDIEKLRDVRLMIPLDKYHHGTGETILDALPANQLSSLDLWSIDEEIEFWSEDFGECDSDNAFLRSKACCFGLNSDEDESSGEELEVEDNGLKDLLQKLNQRENTSQKEKQFPNCNLKISLLQKFTCLRKLCLTVTNSVDDVLMHFISKEFTGLEELEIRNSLKLTDIGLTGRWEEEILGTPITNLKGLKKLTIRRCPHVTFDGVSKAIRFPALRSLDYKDQDCLVPEYFVYEILKQNQSLEELSLRFCFKKETYNSKYKHVNAFTLLSKLKQQSRRRRESTQLYDTNQRLMKLWGAEFYCEFPFYWAHCLYGSGGSNAEESDYG